MEESRRITTVRQLELLVEFLENHRTLALGRVRSKEGRGLSARLWSDCADILNTEGPARTGKEWSKVWNDQKCRIRAKLMKINASQRATGGGPSDAPILTALEDRVANILGRDVGPLPNVRQDQFAANNGDNMVHGEPPLVDDMQEVLNGSPIIILRNIEDEIQDVSRSVTPGPNEIQQIPTSTTPNRISRIRTQRRAARASRQSTARPPAQSNRTALDESRTMILEIEKMRAEAAFQTAQAGNINAEAALKTAQALFGFSESFRLIAESIARVCEKYCRAEPTGTEAEH